jgi:hypothetical protein
MKHLAVAVAGVSVALVAVAAQAPAPKPTPGTAKVWSVPRTPEGKPDLQGNWTNETLTPLERPSGVTSLVMSEAEASLLVDPPDGRVPSITPEAQQRQLERAAANRGRGQYGHPELRPLAERCITSFGSSGGPPMLPNYFDNNNYQIVQTSDHVMILVEMVHDVRTTPSKTHSALVRRLDRKVGS